MDGNYRQDGPVQWPEMSSLAVSGAIVLTACGPGGDGLFVCGHSFQLPPFPCSLDEVPDRVVCGVEHQLQVGDLEEDHDLDGKGGIIRGANTLQASEGDHHQGSGGGHSEPQTD